MQRWNFYTQLFNGFLFYKKNKKNYYKNGSIAGIKYIDLFYSIVIQNWLRIYLKLWFKNVKAPYRPAEDSEWNNWIYQSVAVECDNN